MDTTIILNNGLGVNLGPNFNLTANVGVVTPSTATKSELLAGKSVTVDDSATTITVTSVGTCTNSLILNITGQTTTTTTAGPASFLLGYHNSRFFDSCLDYGATPTIKYMANGQSLAVGNILYDDINLTYFTLNGYYSNGTNWWRVTFNGLITQTGSCATTTTTTSTTSTTTTSTTTQGPTTTTTSTTTIAPIPTQLVSLAYSAVDGPSACYDYNNINPITSSYYIEDGSILDNGTSVYINPTATLRVTSGYYSNGIYHWYVPQSCFEFSLENFEPFDVVVEYFACDETAGFVTVASGTTEIVCAIQIDNAQGCTVTNLGKGICETTGTGVLGEQTLCPNTTTTTTSTSTTSTSTSTTSTSTTSTTTSTTTPPESFQLRYNSESAYAACKNLLSPEITYYAKTGTTLGVGKRLYTDSNLTTYAGIGYYSDTVNWYQINLTNGAIVYSGLCSALTTTTTSTTSTTSTTTAAPTTTSTTSTTTAAPTTTTTSAPTTTTTSAPTTTTTTAAPTYKAFSIAYSATSGAEACTRYPTLFTNTYYTNPNISVLAEGVTIYQNSNLTNPAGNGFYSNGTHYWNTGAGAGNLQNQTLCTGATTSTTSTTSTTTAAPTTTTSTTTAAPTTTTSTTTAAPTTTTTTTTTTEAPTTTTTTTSAPQCTYDGLTIICDSTTTTTTTESPTTSTTTTTTTTAAPANIVMNWNLTPGNGGAGILSVTNASNVQIFSEQTTSVAKSGVFSTGQSNAPLTIKMEWSAGSSNIVRYRICDGSGNQIYLGPDIDNSIGSDSYQLSPTPLVFEVAGSSGASTNPAPCSF